MSKLNEPYVLEKVGEKIEVDNINVVIANGINKRGFSYEKECSDKK